MKVFFFFKIVLSNIRFSSLQKFLDPGLNSGAEVRSLDSRSRLPAFKSKLVTSCELGPEPQPVSLSFVIYKMGVLMQCTYFVELFRVFRVVSELFQVKHSAQDLSCSKHSKNISFLSFGLLAWFCMRIVRWVLFSH